MRKKKPRVRTKSKPQSAESMFDELATLIDRPQPVENFDPDLLRIYQERKWVKVKTGQVVLTKAGREWFYQMPFPEVEEIRWRKEWRPKKNRVRKENELIYPPVLSFLRYDERWWIPWVNKRDYWDEDARPDLIQEIDNILSILHGYLDALAENQKERQKQLEKIAEKIENGMKGAEHGFRANLRFSPDVDYKDPLRTISTMPFTFAGSGGIPAMYESLGRFLASPFVRRLGRCRYCQGLFIAPDDFPYKDCPGTNHKDAYWNKTRGQTGYHAKDMAERRDPHSPKFDKRYI